MKCVDIRGTPVAKASLWTIPDAEVRRLGSERIRYPCSPSSKRCALAGRFDPACGEANVLRHRLGSTVARLKLKEIDGALHVRWSMWLNSMQREELPGLDMLVVVSCAGDAVGWTITGAAWLRQLVS